MSRRTRRKRPPANPWRYAKNGNLRLTAIRRAGLSGEWHMVPNGDGTIDVPREHANIGQWVAWVQQREQEENHGK